MRLTWEVVAALQEHARRRARAAGAEIAVTFVDERGVVVGLMRMDGAIPAAVPGSQAKARTAWLYETASDELASFGPEIGAAAGERTCTFAGGLPLLVGSALVGAVGVSGGTEAVDLEIAEEIRRRLADDAGS